MKLLDEKPTEIQRFSDYLDAVPSEPGCVRAPEEQDSLSELKARAEALMGKLA